MLLTDRYLARRSHARFDCALTKHSELAPAVSENSCSQPQREPGSYGQLETNFLMISLYVRLDWMQKPLSSVST